MAVVESHFSAKQHGFGRVRSSCHLPIVDLDIDFSPLECSYKATNSGVPLPKAVFDVLNEVASNLWPDVDINDELLVDCLQGAMTNKVYSCKWMRTEAGGKSRNALPNRKVILRLYGQSTAVFFARESESAIFELMSSKGQGPRLLAKFPQGRVEEFLHAQTLSAYHLRDPSVSVRIARKLADFHRLPVPGRREAQIWERIRNWYSSALHSCPPELAQSLRLTEMGAEIVQLQSTMTTNEGAPAGVSPVVYCHNDLQYGNIMRDEGEGDVTLIDYEYSCYNPLAYDFANHFCEMTADYHTDKPHWMEWDTYPDVDERRRFVRAYVGEGQESVVDALVEEAELYVVASHLLWGMWGVICSANATTDFDYVAYAVQRLHQYQLTKGRILDQRPHGMLA